MVDLKLNEAERQFFRGQLESKPSGCLEFTGARDRDGYGHFRLKRGARVKVKAHRVAFVDSGGVFPDGKLQVLHRCDNPPCCNPDHLFSGSSLDNHHDMSRKNRGIKSRIGNSFGSRFNQGKWESFISRKGRQVYIGRYESWQEASALAFLEQNLYLADYQSSN